MLMIIMFHLTLKQQVQLLGMGIGICMLILMQIPMPIILMQNPMPISFYMELDELAKISVLVLHGIAEKASL
jgi:hypothetical protein